MRRQKNWDYEIREAQNKEWERLRPETKQKYLAKITKLFLEQKRISIGRIRNITHFKDWLLHRVLRILIEEKVITVRKHLRIDGRLRPVDFEVSEEYAEKAADSLTG